MAIKKVEDLILWNLFFRNFSVIFGIVYISAAFLINIGWENWPSVYQYVQIFVLVFIISTNFINLKSFYQFHKLILISLLLAIGFYVLNPTTAFIITAVAVFIMSLDLIGEITSTNAMMKIIDSLKYKKLSPKIVLYSTCAYILGTISVILVQRFGNHLLFGTVLSIFVGLHFYTFSKMTNNARGSSKFKNKFYEEGVVDKLSETVNYTLKNRLVVMGFALIIWSQVAKFFCDWVYLSSAKIVYPSKEELTTFIGMANLAIMGGVIIFQNLLSGKISTRFSPATLLSFIPISFLVLSLFGQTFNSPYIGISINILFLILFRTLHMPTLKVCMHSIEANIKPKVFLLLNFFISITLLIVTSTIKLFKDDFTINMIFISMIVMAILAIVIIMRFDGLYLRNLWKNVYSESAYKDWSERVQYSETEDEKIDSNFFNPHNYFVEPYYKNMDSEVLELVDRVKLFPKEDASREFIDIFYDESRTAFEKMILIINNFVFSKNLKMFQEGVWAHKHMINSKDQEVAEKAYQLFNLIGIPAFEKFISNGVDSENKMVKNYSVKASNINEFITSLGPKNTIYHKRLKLFVLLNWEYLSPINQRKLKVLITKEHSPKMVDLVSWLGSRKINTTKHDLLKSFDVDSMDFNFKEYIKRYLGHTHEKRVEMQEILLNTPCPENSMQVLEEVLNEHMSKTITEINHDEILDLLFLVEWIHIKGDGYRYALKSVQEYKMLKEGDDKYWKDFHMEFLKKLGLRQFYDLIDTKL